MHRPTLHPPPGLNGFPKLIDQKVQAQLLPLPLDALPAELVLAILARLTSPEDILCCKLVSRRVYQLITTKLARSMAECAIRQNENCWKVEMSRNGGKKWQMEVEQDQEQEQDDAFRPFWHFELSTIALSGPFIANGISLLNRRLRCNRQNRIRNVFVENFEFVDVQSTQTLFGQLIRQKCQRLHLKNCRFNTHFVDHSLLPEQSLNSLDFSLAQFKLEAENCNESECLPKNFVLWTMAKMAGDVRHRIRRPHSSPLLWDSIVPLESATERSAVYAQNLSTKFLFSLAAFVLNWQNVPMPPSFHIRLQRCPRNFSTTFGAFCDRLGISQMNLVFPSLSHRTAHIQGKQNQEKGFFELFSLKDVPSSPVVFCLVSQWTNEYF